MLGMDLLIKSQSLETFVSQANTWGFPGGTSGKELACQCRKQNSYGFGPCWRRAWQPFSILAWRIAWTEDPGMLQSIESQRVGHD